MPYWLLIDIRITPWIYVTYVRDGLALVLSIKYTIIDSAIYFDEKIYACIDTVKRTNLWFKTW